MDDFFGEWVAPATFLTGAGITAYRTFNKVSMDRISSTWRAQKQEREFVNAFKRSRVANKFVTPPESILDSLFPETSKLRATDAFKKIPHAGTYIDTARELTLRNLIHSFGLQNYAQGMVGIDPNDLAAASRGQIQTLLELSPMHMAHTERVARSMGLLSLVNIKTSDPRTLASLSGRATRAMDLLQRTHQAFAGERLGEAALEKLAKQAGALRRIESTAPIRSATQAEALFRQFGFRGNRLTSLTMATKELLETASQHKDISLRMRILNEGNRQVLQGLRVQGAGRNFVDVELVQRGGRVLMGPTGAREFIARKVGSREGVLRAVQAGAGPDIQITKMLDIARIEHLSANLSQYTTNTSDWTRLNRSMTATFREESSKALIPVSANEAQNLKYANQVTFRPSEYWGDITEEELRLITKWGREVKDFDMISGLSPNQITSGVRAVPNPYGRPLGATPFGVFGTGNKTAAQATRPIKIVRQGRGAYTRLVGKAQLAMGDELLQLRTASMPEEILTAMLGYSSRPELQANADIAFLLDRGIRYTEAHSPKLKDLAGPLEDILTSPQYEALRNAALGEGVEARIAHLQGLSGASAEQLAELKALQTQRRLAGNTILGEAYEGGIREAAKQGDFILNKMELDTETGEWILHGVDERRLTVGDKLFYNKRVIGGELARTEGRVMAILHELTASSDEVQAMLAAGDTKGITDYYGKYMKRFRANFEKAVQSNNGFAPRYSDRTIRKMLSGAEFDVFGRKAIKAAIQRTRGVQLLESQGIKKIGEKGLGNVVERMAGELAERHRALGLGSLSETELRGVVADWSQKLRTGEIAGDKYWQLDKRMMRARALLAKGHPSSEAGRKARRERARIENVFSRIGITPDEGGRYLVEDAPGTRRNLAYVFDVLAAATARGSSTLDLWSPVRMLEQVSADLINVEEAGTAMREAIFGRDLDITDSMVTSAHKNFQQLADSVRAGHIQAHEAIRHMPREAIVHGIEPQLRYGMRNAFFSMEASPALSTASGGRGSFSLQAAAHLRAQGGVMEDLSKELMGRIVGDKYEQAQGIARRMSAFAGETTGPAISLEELGRKYTANDPVFDQLFSATQTERDVAFRRIQGDFGLDPSDELLFDAGEGRQILHPRAISAQTGSFITADERMIKSGIDRSLSDLIRGHIAGNADQIAEARASYKEALTRLAVGKEGPLMRVYSGKAQGTMRGQARPQFAQGFFDFIGEEYADRVGVKEADFKSMLADMGAVEGPAYDERLKLLREGRLGTLISRDPLTEKYRIAAVEAFSVDQAMEEYVKRTVGTNISDLQSQHALLAGRKRHNALIRRFEGETAEAQERLGEALKEGKDRKIFAAQRMVDDLPKQHRDQLIRAIAGERMAGLSGSPILLPRHMERILGADYDNDHLNMILARSPELQRRLGVRAGYQRGLIQLWKNPNLKKLSGDDLIARFRRDKGLTEATISKDQLAAEEDFLYKMRQEEVYSKLYDRPGGVISRSDLEVGSEGWRARAEAEQLAAQLEKGEIGSMTNATDFVRSAMRGKGKMAQRDARIFQEMLLGIMPEMPLKGKQFGAQNLPEKAEHILRMRDILSGRNPGGLDTGALTRQYEESFRAIMGSGPTVDELTSYIPDILEEVHANQSRANEFTRTLKKRAVEQVELDEIMRNVADETIANPHAQFIRDATSDMRATSKLSGAARHLSNVRETFNDVYGVLKQNKGPLLIGTAAAVGISMLLGGGGHISEEEVQHAGRRHSESEPTVPPIDPSHSARVTPTSGGSIRIRARSDGTSPEEVSQMLRNRYPGADVSVNINDYSTSINEEYLRRRMQ